MEPDKNLHATIPVALLMEAQNLAQAEHITLDELVQDALEQWLRERRRYSYHTPTPSRIAS